MDHGEMVNDEAGGSERPACPGCCMSSMSSLIGNRAQDGMGARAPDKDAAAASTQHRPRHALGWCYRVASWCCQIPLAFPSERIYAVQPCCQACSVQRAACGGDTIAS
jgi:hypothetical protein